MMVGSIKFSLNYRIQGYITIDVEVESYGFKGSYPWCVPENYLLQKITEFKLLLDNDCEWRFEETDSDDYLEIKRCHLDVYKGKQVYTVRGQLGGSFNTQYLVFEYPADKKDVEKYLDNLKNLLH